MIAAAPPKRLRRASKKDCGGQAQTIAASIKKECVVVKYLNALGAENERNKDCVSGGQNIEK
eukprot:11556300-Alexandrium_andersonii.AAC.1